MLSGVTEGLPIGAFARSAIKTEGRLTANSLLEQIVGGGSNNATQRTTGTTHSVEDHIQTARLRMANAKTQYGELGAYGGEGYASYGGYLMDNEVPEGYISGFREIIAKARAAKAGDIGALGEIEAAKTIRASGRNVHFQTPTGKRSYLGNTADFLVGGDKGTGLNGIPMDVLTPIVGKRSSIISGIASKTNQAQHIIVNLRHANPKIRAAEIGSPNDVVNEIINDFANSHSTAKYLRSVEFQE